MEIDLESPIPAAPDVGREGYIMKKYHSSPFSGGPIYHISGGRMGYTVMRYYINVLL